MDPLKKQSWMEKWRDERTRQSWAGEKRPQVRILVRSGLSENSSVRLEGEWRVNQTQSFSHINSNNIQLVWFYIISLFPCPAFSLFVVGQMYAHNTERQEMAFPLKTPPEIIIMRADLDTVISWTSGWEGPLRQFLQILIRIRAFLIKCTHLEEHSAVCYYFAFELFCQCYHV